MTYYSTLEKDEEDIIIPFVVSLSITSTKIVELLPEYLECLRRDECPEVLGVDLDMMTSTAYWMKNDKLKHDMEAQNDLTLHERGLEFAYKGFKPATTLELYQAIKKNVDDMVAMLSDNEQQTMIELGMMLDLIHEDMKELMSHEVKPVPMIQAIIWAGRKKLDSYFQTIPRSIISGMNTARTRVT